METGCTTLEGISPRGSSHLHTSLQNLRICRMPFSPSTIQRPFLPLPLPALLPLPLSPPYFGPLLAARCTESAIHSLVVANAGRVAPMCWKYFPQESVDAFTSLHFTWSFSS